MVSKTDDIPASVPDCNPVELADEPGDGAQDGKETSRTRLKDSCGCGESAAHTRVPALHDELINQLICPMFWMLLL